MCHRRGADASAWASLTPAGSGASLRVRRPQSRLWGRGMSPEFVPDPPIRCRDVPIGAVGAGFIMADVQLAAYAEAGFPVVAIASRTPAKAAEVAAAGVIPTVHATPEALIEDPAGRDPRHRLPARPAAGADPPRARPAAHRGDPGAEAAGAWTSTTPKALVDEARAAGKVVSVNQNMRFDQSMRVLKQMLDRGELGAPVLATIEMRAIPHWQPFLARLRPADAARHVRSITSTCCASCSATRPTSTPPPAPTRARSFAHRDGITASTLRFPSGAAGGVAGGRLVRAARGGLCSPTSTSNGGSRGPTAWRRARSAGPTTRPASPSTLRYASTRDHGRPMGRAELGRRAGSRTPSRA